MNTILVDPGGSQLSLGLSRVSELKNKVYGRSQAENSLFKATKSKYSPKVLIGNWYEDRPDLYTPVENSWSTQVEDINRCHRFNYKNENYDNNFSTCYDLSYRVLPKGLDGPRIRTYNSRENKWLPEEDLCKNYGNVTRYGLVEYIRAIEAEANRIEKPRTNYQCDYTVKQPPIFDKRYHRKRVDINTPNLQHLNIDLNTC